MEAQLILTDMLPYSKPDIFWSKTGDLEPEESRLDVTLRERSLKWRIVRETLECFTTTPGTDETIECDIDGKRTLYDMYKCLKELQRKHKGSHDIVVKMSDETANGVLVNVFLASVHLAADRVTGAEPNDTPTIRFTLQAYGQSLLREMTWMLDPMNPIETTKCSEIINLFHWYRNLV